MSVTPRAPLGAPVPSGAYGVYAFQEYWDDGPTVLAIYTADHAGNPIVSQAQAQTLAAKLQTIAADPAESPLHFIVLPLMSLPDLGP